ncbi:MAG TPA: biotin/lipoyl-containing protein [Myxococcota bacterium]|nr:biotin/lipoyl-containing protein [Myxococcota bacterium]
MKRVSVMTTAFRDGFQSCVGARVLTDDFLPAVEAALAAGFTHFEAGGGARYQVPYLYCNEDAFDMMDRFRATVGPEANLQTLARGVNVVGLDSQSSDIIDLHAKMFAKHGMTTIRNFDALNDVRNLAFSGRCIAEAGLKHEVVVAMMALPPGTDGAHTPEFYLKVVHDLLEDGVPFSSVCFKDASGTATPSTIYETIRLARRRLPEGTHIRVHTHETAGCSVMQYKAALDAGADGIDLSLAPCSGGTAQPDAVVMWHALRGTDYDLGFDIDKVLEAEEVFKDCMKDYFMPPEASAVEPIIPFSPMPGGALTANTQMMRDNNMLDRYPAVIRAMKEVVGRGGFGTSVTPVSQFYFQQAFNNAVIGPWKRIADGYGKMVLGYFGRTPQPPDPEIVALAAEQLQLEPTTRDPREINDEDPAKGVPAATERLKAHGLPISDESVFISASLKDKGIAFLKGEATIGVRKKSKEARADTAPADRYSVSVGGRSFEVRLEGGRAIVGGRSYDYRVEAGGSDESATPTAGSPVNAEMPGKIVDLKVGVGDSVSEGQALLVMEALKMELDVAAPRAGTVASIAVTKGQQVAAGDLLVSLS